MIFIIHFHTSNGHSKKFFVLWISIVHAQIRFPVKSERQRMSECEDIVIQSAGTYVSGFGTIKKNVAMSRDHETDHETHHENHTGVPQNATCFRD